MDMQVIQIDPDTGVVTLGIPTVPKVLRGIDKLTQLVALFILRNPGQDVFEPSEGPGFRDMIGQYNFTSPEEIRGVVVQRIKLMERQILELQSSTGGAASERLKELSLKDMAYDALAPGLLVRIKIVSEAGAESDVVV